MRRPEDDHLTEQEVERACQLASQCAVACAHRDGLEEGTPEWNKAVEAYAGEFYADECQRKLDDPAYEVGMDWGWKEAFRRYLLGKDGSFPTQT